MNKYQKRRSGREAQRQIRLMGETLAQFHARENAKPPTVAEIFARNRADKTVCPVTGDLFATAGALPRTFMGLAPGSRHPEVWHDVNRMFTLNSEQTNRNLEKHVCPLQFDIVDRLIERYSNPGETVFDPFLGIGTTAVRAIGKGRSGKGSELSEAYFRDAVRYCRLAEERISMPTLFDLPDASGASPPSDRLDALQHAGRATSPEDLRDHRSKSFGRGGGPDDLREAAHD